MATTRSDAPSNRVRGAVEQGSLYLVDKTGVLVGIYAVPRAVAHGLSGFRVQEKIIFERIRGTGLGRAIEQRVLHSLPASADDVVFGSVESGNIPSLRTAASVGRIEIGARTWLTPFGRPGMPAAR